MTIFIKNKHTLQIDDFIFRCCIGKKGLTINKKEGDKKTPKGSFYIENLYFRKDRLNKPQTSLKCIEIKKNKDTQLQWNPSIKMNACLGINAMGMTVLHEFDAERK